MVSSTGGALQLSGDYKIARSDSRAHAQPPFTMNEFLTSYSSGHTLLWALLIIGVVAAAAIGLHLFWTAVFRTVTVLRGVSRKGPGGGG